MSSFEKNIGIHDQDLRKNNDSGDFEFLKPEFGDLKFLDTRIQVFWIGFKNLKADGDDRDIIHHLLRFSKRDEEWLTNL